MNDFITAENAEKNNLRFFLCELCASSAAGGEMETEDQEAEIRNQTSEVSRLA